MTQTCVACGLDQPLTEFGLVRPGGKHRTTCKECCRAYGRQNYRDNAQRYKDCAKARKADLLRRFWALKEAKPCMDCHKHYPHYVMDYDHRPGTEKVAGLAQLIRTNASWEKLMAEVAKCDLICSNCHRARTYLRGGTWAQLEGP